MSKRVPDEDASPRDVPERKPKGAAKPPHHAEDKAKHAFAAERLPEPEEGGGTPAIRQSYGTDRIAAMPRSPQYLFIYWELNGPRSAPWRDKPGARANWVLRVRESASGWQNDIPVDPESGNFYLKAKPGGRYVAELGVSERDKFHLVCTSRERALPVGAPPEAAPVVWAGLQTGGPAGRTCPQPKPLSPEFAGIELGLKFDPSLLAGSSWSGAKEDEED